MSELGSWLIRAREARGLTLEDAERDTRISRRYLQALESEQFELIPAPVYARGFLRSYSQYLGLDPQEVLALFPRDDDGPAPYKQTPSSQRSAIGSPPTSASRPSWRRPAQESNPAPARPQRPATRELPLEPTIGIDIGLPPPARRLDVDSASQARSLTVLVTAVGAVLAVLLLAIIISRIGGGESGTTPTATSTSSVTANNSPTPDAAALGVTPDVVPEVVGEQATRAKTLIAAAGFEVIELSQPGEQPRGQVITQSPAAGAEKSAGYDAVTIVVSLGP